MEPLRSVLSIFQSNFFETIISRIESGQGFLVTVIGLLAVFSGLLLLWAITANLQKINYLFEQKPEKKKTAQLEPTPSEGERENQTLEEIATAISVALCYELEEEDMSVITLRHIEQEMSPWVVASRPTTMRHSS